MLRSVDRSISFPLLSSTSLSYEAFGCLNLQYTKNKKLPQSIFEIATDLIHSAPETDISLGKMTVVIIGATNDDTRVADALEIEDAPEEKNEENGEVPRWDNNSRSGYRRFDDDDGRMVGEGIYRVGPVLATLSAGRREFYALYVQEGLDLSNNKWKKKDKKGFEKIFENSQKLGLPPKGTSKHDLNMVADNCPHQGLVLGASPLEMVKIRELDPLSLEGNNGVVLCAKNSAPLSGVVSKASAGLLELMELRDCKNMMQFLSQSAKNGWRVLGGSISLRTLPLNKVYAVFLLVLGSEETGLRSLVERSCTDLIRIPGNIPVDISVGSAEDAKSKVDIGSGTELRSFF
ncbi:hypothetical protein GIB67_028252 [Kingdonia uniflora]|uniref:rRNA methyltransferase 1, mitochondrial n=1 Tax=Kingdonia uniflora TaxID=39325 RepID=A0A7J7KZ77_9MAGN|nr:hypothetical protein GIB67_028252 [Kingdonia uniflora]